MPGEGACCGAMLQGVAPASGGNVNRVGVGLRSSAYPSKVVVGLPGLDRTPCRLVLRRGQPLVLAAARGGDSFQDRARETADSLRRNSAKVAQALSEKAADLFDSAKYEASRFERRNDLTGKAKQLFVTAGEKYEELEYNLKREGARLNMKYKVSEKARRFADSFADKAETVDRSFGIRRRLQEFSTDLRLKMPMYQRQLRIFMNTPGGQFLGVCLFAWLALSGWLFRIIVWSLWILPLLPFFLRLFIRDSFVQGSCQNCGLPYTGPKTAVLACARCRQIVWQPGQTFNKNDPNIIDIEAE